MSSVLTNGIQKVLIVGAGDFQLSLVKKASEQCEVYVCAPEIDDRFTPYLSGSYFCDVRDKENILSYASRTKIQGVLTDGTDIPVRTVAYVAEKMGLPGIGSRAASLFSEKNLMRAEMQKMGFPLIPYCAGKSVSDVMDFVRDTGFPLMIKPTDSQGSRGITKISDVSQLQGAFENAARYASDGKVIVEKYIDGIEMVVEAATIDSVTTNLIYGDTIYFDDNRTFAAKSRTFPSVRDLAICRKVLELNQRLIECFGLKFGITHAEYIYDGQKPYLIEIAARGGGVFISSDIIELCTGVDTSQLLLDLALHGTARIQPEKRDVFAGYRAFYLPEGEVIHVRGVEQVQNLPYVSANQLGKIKEGMVIPKNVDKTSRFAMVVTGRDEEEWQEHVQQIRRILDIQVSHNGRVNTIIWD